jgi:prophage regulatory protein
MDDKDRLIHIREVEVRTGLKKSAIYERAANDLFPKPIKIGSATRWSEHEIDEWIEKQKRARIAA